MSLWSFLALMVFLVLLSQVWAWCNRHYDHWRLVVMIAWRDWLLRHYYDVCMQLGAEYIESVTGDISSEVAQIINEVTKTDSDTL